MYLLLHIHIDQPVSTFVLNKKYIQKDTDLSMQTCIMI